MARKPPPPSKGRPKGVPNKDKREQIELLGALREIVSNNVEGLRASFPGLVERRPVDAWKIAITICPKEMRVEAKGLELPPIAQAIGALVEEMKRKGTTNGDKTDN